jgi:alpha-pyrone synthase
VHPGGTRIIQKVQRSLDLTDDQVADSWEVLRQYGNMLSPSVLFVMQRMLNRLEQSRHPEDNFPTPVDPGEGWQDTAQPSLTGLAFSFSPGVGVEGILFQTL